MSESEKEENKKAKRSKQQERAEKEANIKGTDFDDMIAYVDEDGNITSTPPDPSKKEKVKAEDIVVGVPKKEDLGPEDKLRKGKVKYFDESKGYGFIKDQETQQDVFVHISSCKDEIAENDKVSFEIEKTPKGLSAIDVRLI